MCRDDDSGASLCQFVQECDDIRPRIIVLPEGGFVDDDKVRLGDGCRHKGKAAFLSPREREGVSPFQLGKPHEFESTINVLGGSMSVDPRDTQPERDFGPGCGLHKLILR